MLLTQTKWLGMMSAREFEISPAAPFGGSSSLLKRHKVLPHPREQPTWGFHSSPPPSRNRILGVDTEIDSAPNSQTSSPRMLKHASRRIGAPNPPPTPPTHSRQSSSGNATTERTLSHDDNTDVTSVPTTPPNQRSPPTPDFTPPRALRRPTSLRPPHSVRIPSSHTESRTDSFKTARETPYSSSDDEVSTVRPILPSTRPSEVEIPQLPNIFNSREIGLGLGLELDSERTPSPRPRRISLRDDFGAFDGEWGLKEGEAGEVEREWDDNLMRNVTVRRRPHRISYIYDDSPISHEVKVVDDNLVSPTNATKLLRDYSLSDTNSSNSATRDEVGQTPKNNFSLHALWPNGIAAPMSPQTPDVRRFSTMSTRSMNSAVVEAMVVDTMPQRRRTLRHTKKQLGLRDFSSDLSTQSSAQSSGTERSVSDGLSHRLNHKTAKLPERRHRSIQSSNPTCSTSSSARSRREIWNNGSIPVVIVPERVGSMKSAQTPSLRSSSSRRSKRAASLSSAPVSNSSRSHDLGYFDIPKLKPRRLSEPGELPVEPQPTMDGPPNIPARRSSLSAPTSRNTSRAGSLTAESLRAHNTNQAMEATKLRFAEDLVPLGSPKESRHDRTVSVDHNGDPFFGSRLSTQVTPFSQISYATSGTGAEVAEALAVNLYPHQNKSLVVVDQRQSTTSQCTPQEIPNSSLLQPSMALDEITAEVPVTPPQPIQTMDEVDSPLRNPRAPPQPPAIKFIPPTPNVLTPAQEEQKQLGYDVWPTTSDATPRRGLSLIRRALSSRRHSESLIGRAFSLKRREFVDDTSHGNINPGTMYPSVDEQPADGSKLHPFWRPAHFWNDLEDDEEYQQYSDRDFYPPVDNRPGPPKRSLSGTLKRTFAILPIQDDPQHAPYWTERRTVRRSGSGNLRVVKQRGSKDSLRRSISDGRYYVTDAGVNHAGRVHIRWASLKGLSRRMSEKRRERRNEKLRLSISAPRDAIDGVDNVLRGPRNLMR